VTSPTPLRDALRSWLPPSDAPEAAWPEAFRALAELLLNRVTVHVGGAPHRYTEVEFYADGPEHGDPFTHGDPMQRELGRWYFHRTGGTYRGGTYKGHDLTIGRADTAGGVLIRGLQRLDDSRRVDGPSTCVDHLLALTGHGGVASLAGSFDRAVDPPAAGASPLFATVDASTRGLAVYATPRVGLSLKRGVTPGRLRFLARPYRFLTEPARVRKGRAHLVVSLHCAGHGAAVIAALTGVRLGQVARCAAMYEAGRAMDPSALARDLSAEETCQLLGACERYLTAR
jgi:hypothetical protein